MADTLQKVDLRSAEEFSDQNVSMQSTAQPSEVLLFAFEYPPVSGGISRLSAEIGGILARGGAPTRVLTQDCATPINCPVLPETRVVARRPFREWQAFRWLRKRGSAASARGSRTICAVWYPEGLIAYLCRVHPLIILAHGSELLPSVNRFRRAWWGTLQRRVLEHADLVIANSGYTRELVFRAAPKSRVTAIPLAVDSNRFVPGDAEAAKAKFGVAGKRVLCTVSRIERYKAHDTVLRAVASLESTDRENLVYLIAGEGPYELNLRNLASELGIEAHVRWLGFLSEEELPDLYRASDLFALCTRDSSEERSVEGFGLVLLEAQSCGTPVVGARSGGIPDAVRERDGGWLIEPDDVLMLKDLIREMVRSPGAFRAEGVKARQRVLRECTWDRYGEQLERALEEVGDLSGKATANPTPSNAPEQARGVSIVVATLNRGSCLIDTLHDLLAQDYRPIEILVVDQSSEENSALLNVALQHPSTISYHKVAFRGLPLARNYGWQLAKYENIIFVDDDIRCGPSLVREHVRGLSQPSVGMVAGGIDEAISSKKDGGPPGRFNSWTATPVRNFGARKECLAEHVAGCNFSVTRSVLRAAGGFDEVLSFGAALYEETELCLRVQKSGFDIYFNGNARLQHLAVPNGGCRVPDLARYVESLAHNRAILIGRYLERFQVPFAYFRLLLLFVSYSARYRTMSVFGAGIRGLLNGVKAARRPPVCTDYAPWVRA
jgi:phosphatidyl-myo-inositol dimannoside synthase